VRPACSDARMLILVKQLNSRKVSLFKIKLEIIFICLKKF
jgi:hypothetical protein